MSATLSTAEHIANIIGTDGTKLIEALPAIQTAYNSVQATLSADQHASVFQKVADLASAVTPSVVAAENAGLLGNSDATHAQALASAVVEGASQATFWSHLWATVRSWF